MEICEEKQEESTLGCQPAGQINYSAAQACMHQPKLQKVENVNVTRSIHDGNEASPKPQN